MDKEAQRLVEEMRLTIAKVANSAFYHYILQNLQGDTFRSHLIRVLGNNSCFKMVIYALGSIESSYRSKYQFALVILLRRDFPFLIEKIEAFDPVFSLRDTQVMEAWGCDVLKENEFRKRVADTPTLFYMPYADGCVLWELFNVNWCPSHLNQMVVLSNPLERYDKTPIAPLRLQLMAILKFVHSFELPKYCENWSQKFIGNFSWHFFDVDPSQDMEALLLACASSMQFAYTSPEIRLERQRSLEVFSSKREGKVKIGHVSGGCNEVRADKKYRDSRDPTDFSWLYLCPKSRVPCNYSQEWCLPPQGCIKLNFAVVQSHGQNPVRFGVGGAVHDGNGRLVAYYGNAGDGDRVKANAVSLKQGIIWAKDWITSETRLIVEGNDLSFIECANGVTTPPESAASIIAEIKKMLVDIESSIYHVYYKANDMAIKLAEKGLELELHENCFKIDLAV